MSWAWGGYFFQVRVLVDSVHGCSAHMFGQNMKAAGALGGESLHGDQESGCTEGATTNETPKGQSQCST